MPFHAPFPGNERLPGLFGVSGDPWLIPILILSDGIDVLVARLRFFGVCGAAVIIGIGDIPFINKAVRNRSKHADKASKCPNISIFFSLRGPRKPIAVELPASADEDFRVLGPEAGQRLSG